MNTPSLDRTNMTEPLFQEDGTCACCEARGRQLSAPTASELDRTVFYPMGGEQPGDSGRSCVETTARVIPSSTRRHGHGERILHRLAATRALLRAVGETVSCRARLGVVAMPTCACTTCLHLLWRRACATAVTGGSVGARAQPPRLRHADSVDRERVDARLNDSRQRRSRGENVLDWTHQEPRSASGSDPDVRP